MNIRWVTLAVLVVFLLAPGVGMAQMTVAQKATLKTDITVTNAGEFSALVAAKDYQPIADAYNALASPDFYIWRTAIPPEEYTGPNAIVWTEVDAMTGGKARIFEWMTKGLTGPINAADPNKRAGLGNAFGAGSATATNLTLLAKRKAKRAEKLFADTSGGNGVLGNPATLTFEGTVTRCDVAKSLEGEGLPC